MIKQYIYIGIVLYIWVQYGDVTQYSLEWAPLYHIWLTHFVFHQNTTFDDILLP